MEKVKKTSKRLSRNWRNPITKIHWKKNRFDTIREILTNGRWFKKDDWLFIVFNKIETKISQIQQINGTKSNPKQTLIRHWWHDVTIWQ